MICLFMLLWCCAFDLLARTLSDKTDGKQTYNVQVPCVRYKYRFCLTSKSLVNSEWPFFHINIKSYILFAHTCIITEHTWYRRHTDSPYVQLNDRSLLWTYLAKNIVLLLSLPIIKVQIQSRQTIFATFSEIVRNATRDRKTLPNLSISRDLTSQESLWFYSNNGIAESWCSQILGWVQKRSWIHTQSWYSSIYFHV